MTVEIRKSKGRWTGMEERAAQKDDAGKNAGKRSALIDLTVEIRKSKGRWSRHGRPRVVFLWF